VTEEHLNRKKRGRKPPQIVQFIMFGSDVKPEVIREALAALKIADSPVEQDEPPSSSPPVPTPPVVTVHMGSDGVVFDRSDRPRKLRRYPVPGSLQKVVFSSKADFRERMNRIAADLQPGGGEIEIGKLIDRAVSIEDHSANSYRRAVVGGQSYFLDKYPPFPWTDANVPLLLPANADEFEFSRLDRDFRALHYHPFALELFGLELDDVLGRRSEEIYDFQVSGDQIEDIRLRASREFSVSFVVHARARRSGLAQYLLLTINNRLQQQHDFQVMCKVLDPACVDDALRLSGKASTPIVRHASAPTAQASRTRGCVPRSLRAHAGRHAASRSRVA
jgi:hypothetical protein